MTRLECPFCLSVGEFPPKPIQDCPSCQRCFRPGPALPPPAPVPTPHRLITVPAIEVSRCPFCFELTIAGARKCKHCGELLDPALIRAQARESHQPQPQTILFNNATTASSAASSSRGRRWTLLRYFGSTIAFLLTVLLCAFVFLFVYAVVMAVLTTK